jgi:hypothetical protein
MYLHSLLQFFKSDHLPPHLRSVSKPFEDLAMHLSRSLPDGAEKSAALRKLLEAKDCAVRSVLYKSLPIPDPKAVEAVAGLGIPYSPRKDGGKRSEFDQAVERLQAGPFNVGVDLASKADRDAVFNAPVVKLINVRDPAVRDSSYLDQMAEGIDQIRKSSAQVDMTIQSYGEHLQDQFKKLEALGSPQLKPTPAPTLAGYPINSIQNDPGTAPPAKLEFGNPWNFTDHIKLSRSDVEDGKIQSEAFHEAIHEILDASLKDDAQ